VVATLAYRLASFWLPIPAGGVAAIIHNRKYGSADVALLTESEAEPDPIAAADGTPAPVREPR
jgi:hypothetical protein